MARKPRSDRNHVIYRLTAPDGDAYIGVTFARARAYKKSARLRFESHCRSAFRYGSDCLLHQALRKHGRDSFRREVLEVVRGKAAAHARERQLIAEHQPELNMEGMGRKRR